jgi:hypothetical protein
VPVSVESLSAQARVRGPILEEPAAWVAASIAGGIFLLLAGLSHIVEIVRDKNYAPGNTAILLSDSACRSRSSPC